MRKIVIYLIIGFFQTICSFADGENLSLGKPYFFAPLPSYEHCTDQGDMKQLKDGEIFKPGDSGALWTWKGTVGLRI